MNMPQEKISSIPPPKAREERVQVRTMASDIASLKRTGGEGAVGSEEEAPSIRRSEEEPSV